MPDTSILLVACLVFLVAGFVKGFVGFGLPLVAVGLLATIIGLQPAIALLLVPSVGTNLWQALSGANTAELFRRFWTFFVATMIFTWPGTLALSRVNPDYLSGLLGMLLLVYVILSLSRVRFAVPKQLEASLNPVMGITSGVLAGMTGAFTMPGVVYLQSTLLPSDQLVQALGMLFTLATVGLGLSMGAQELLTGELLSISAVALVPTFAGVLTGARLRKRTSEEGFRLFFLLALGVLGLYITARSGLALMAPAGP
jgi:uncharacterized membrane protein YfcA